MKLASCEQVVILGPPESNELDNAESITTRIGTSILPARDVALRTLQLGSYSKGIHAE
jgi:hypothetical protein